MRLADVMMSRVAAYVEEPYATEIRKSEQARNEAIEEARPYLEELGWRELVFVGAQWDDHPQVGQAFYIHFRGLPPRDRSFVQEFGGVDCVHFAPAPSEARPDSPRL